VHFWAPELSHQCSLSAYHLIIQVLKMCALWYVTLCQLVNSKQSISPKDCLTLTMKPVLSFDT
jgi:hypothetical protein